MSYPSEVPVLGPEDTKKPLALWFLEIFPQENVTSLFAVVHHFIVTGKRKYARPYRRALSFNVTCSLMGYIDGQSQETLSLTEALCQQSTLREFVSYWNRTHLKSSMNSSRK